MVGARAVASDWWGLWISMRTFGAHSGHCFVAMRKGLCEVKGNSFLSSKNAFQRVFAGQSLRPALVSARL